MKEINSQKNFEEVSSTTSFQLSLISISFLTPRPARPGLVGGKQIIFKRSCYFPSYFCLELPKLFSLNYKLIKIQTLFRDECDVIDDDSASEKNSTTSKTFGSDKKNPLLVNKGFIAPTEMKVFQSELQSERPTMKYETLERGSLCIMKVKKTPLAEAKGISRSTKVEDPKPLGLKSLKAGLGESKKDATKVKKTLLHSMTSRALDSPAILKRILKKGKSSESQQIKPNRRTLRELGCEAI